MDWCSSAIANDFKKYFSGIHKFLSKSFKLDTYLSKVAGVIFNSNLTTIQACYIQWKKVIIFADF